MLPLLLLLLLLLVVMLLWPVMLLPLLLTILLLFSPDARGGGRSGGGGARRYTRLSFRGCAFLKSFPAVHPQVNRSRAIGAEADAFQEGSAGKYIYGSFCCFLK